MIVKSKLTSICLAAVFIFLGYIVISKFFVRKYNNAIIILIDTLRADHLSVYGYKRNTSPALDALARENVMATRAISVAPWTPPSTASILTGLSVPRHGYSPSQMESVSKKKGEVLREDVDTLAEILKKYGYQTAAVSASPWMSPYFNFDQGFDNFIHERRSATEIIMNASKKQLEDFSRSEPFFLYMHILDPHGPYTPKGQYANMFSGKVEGTWPYSDEMQNIINRYDAEIRSVDDQIADLFSFLKEKGRYDDTAIIIVSDHGEQFDEHGDTGHGKMLHIEEVHVPLIVKCMGHKKVVNEAVSNMDVTPTLLDCLGINVGISFDGISVLNDEKVKTRVGTFSSVKRAYLQEAFTTSDGMRIINSKGRAATPKQDWEVLGTYNLNSDPLEANPGFEPGFVSELQGYLNSAKALLTPKKAVESQVKEVPKETMEQLETLGYIND